MSEETAIANPSDDSHNRVVEQVARRPARFTVNRSLVGILAVACLLGAAAIWIVSPRGEIWQMWLGGFTRVGLLLAAFWLALPTKGRAAAWANMSPWILVGIVLAGFAAKRLPLRVMLPLAVVLSVVGYVLSPPRKKRPTPRGPRDL